MRSINFKFWFVRLYYRWFGKKHTPDPFIYEPDEKN